jgi:hypothetical protein
MQQVNDRVSYTALLVLGALCIMGFLCIRLPRAVRGNDNVLGDDGPGYYSYLRSLVFDHDLDFRNEYSHLRPVVPGGMAPTSTGLLPNVWTIGPAFLWAPFYLAAHTLSLVAHATGAQVDIDGYGYGYQAAVCIATIVYVTAGWVLTYRVCRRHFSPCVSLVAVVGIWLASSLFHYTVNAAGSSHGVSFFAVSLFLFLWSSPRSRALREWTLLGLSGGLMTLVRPQNVLFLSILVIEGVYSIATASGAKNRIRALGESLEGAAVVGILVLIVFTPQMLAWNSLYGSPLTVPAGQGDFFDWAHPDLLEYLFATRPGLYTAHPIMLLATVGFVPLWRRDRKLAVVLLTPLLLQWYLNSAIAEGYEAYGGGFGARRFIGSIPLLALGMAAFTEWVANRFRRGSMAAVASVTALAGWNFLFDLQFCLGFIRSDQPLSFWQLTIGKFEMTVELITRLLVPP